MNRFELVKSAIAHRQTEKIPSCIHLAGDGQENILISFLSGMLQMI